MSTDKTRVGALKRKMWFIIASGLPFDHDIDVLRKMVLLNVIIILGGLCSIVLGIVAFAQRNLLLAAGDAFFSMILAVLFIYLRVTKDHRRVSVIGTMLTGLFYAFLIATGGVDNTAYLWSFTYPHVSLFLLGTTLGVLLSLSLLFLATLVFALGPEIDFLAVYSSDLIIRYIPAFVIFLLLAYLMEKVRQIVQARFETANLELGEAVLGLEKANSEKQSLIQDLRDKIDEIKTLRGIIPICANCKKIRDDKGYWGQVEKYIQDHSEAQFSHSICPECVRKLYPEFSRESDKLGDGRGSDDENEPDLDPVDS